MQPPGDDFRRVAVEHIVVHGPDEPLLNRTKINLKGQNACLRLVGRIVTKF